MHLNFDIVVVGAGISGMSAALAMAQRGHTVALIDKIKIAASHSPLGRVYALNDASFKLLRDLGTLELIPKHDYNAYTHMDVWVADSQAKLDFNADQVGCTHLGWMIAHDVLHEALFKQIQSHPNLTCFSNTHLKTIQEEEKSISVKDETRSWTSPLLIIADGANSQLIQYLNLPVTAWSYHQHALITVVETELPHKNTAYQIFLPSGPLAFLPLQNPHQCAIVWSTTKEAALSKLTDDAFNKALTHAFQKRLGEVKRLGPCTHFPLQMRHTQQYSGKHWLLLGDAAHTIHPLAGQGLNLGLADLNCWLTQFKTYGFERLERALKAYQRDRKYHVWQMILLLESIYGLTTHPTFPLTWMRDISFKVCNDLSFLKRFLIEQARGITGSHT